MRRIGESEKLDERRRKGSLVIAVIILALMILSTAGFAFLSGGHTSTSNSNQDVQPVQRQNIFNIAGKNIILTHSADELTNNNLNFSITLNDYNSKTLFLVTKDSQITNEITASLGLFVPRIQNACLGSCDEDLPEKTCAENIIIIEDSQTENVYQSQNCIFIEGDLKTLDSFLYKLFGIR